MKTTEPKGKTPKKRKSPLKKLMVRKFKGRSQDLYDVARQMYASCKLKMLLFFKFSELYTDALVEERLTAVTAAEALPDTAARKKDAKEAHKEMKKLRKGSTNQWKLMERYILKAFPADQQKLELEAAGQGYLKKALANQWGDVAALILAGDQYLALNAKKLEANKNMPAGFVQAFKDAGTAFNDMRSLYLLSDSESKTDTLTKVEANNAVYQQLMDMADDGKEILKSSPDEQRLFVYDLVLDSVRARHQAGVKGGITDALTQKAIEGVLVAVKDKGTSTQTDAKGRYEIKLPAGAYTLVFTAAGYQPVTIEGRKVQAGVMGLLSLEMLAIGAELPTVAVEAQPEEVVVD